MTITSSGKAWKAHVRTAVEEADTQFKTSGLSWGTYPGHDPNESLAADAMIPKWTLAAGILIGNVLAAWGWKNSKRLGIWYIIWRGRIISNTRPAAGWLPYFDRNNANPSRSHKNHNHWSWYAKAPEPKVPSMPSSKIGDDSYLPAKPWTCYLDKLQPGVVNSDSVWLLQKALGIKPRTGAFTAAETAAIKKWQAEVMKDDPKYCDGILGAKQAKALFGPLVRIELSSK